MKPFEIFRTGNHTSSQGKALAFSDGDIAAIVSGYNPDLHHAPIVVGHPKQDAPAYGWVQSLEKSGDRIVAKPADLDAAFSDLVKDKKFRKVSAAFYEPSSPNNPTPGSYYLRHVGFLGAAAPAVKGLKAIEFADEPGVLVVEFDDIELSDWKATWAIDATARLFRGLREWLIEKEDVATADKIVPSWDIEQLTATAAEIRAEDRAEAKPFFTEPKGPTMKTAAELALEERETKIARREATFAEQEKVARGLADAAFVDGVVKAGRLPVGLTALATALFADLGDEELTFADGGETKKTSARAAFRDLLEKLPVPVVTNELAKGETVDFSDAAAVTVAIQGEMKTAADKGEAISPAEAAHRLQNRSQ